MKSNRRELSVVELVFLENGKKKRYFRDKKRNLFYWKLGNRK